MVPAQGVTYPAEVSESDAIGCNVHSGPVTAPECHVCEGADRADVSGAKTATEYSADQPAETLGVAGSSLLCSGSDLTAHPLMMLHLQMQGGSGKTDSAAMALVDSGASYNFILSTLAKSLGWRHTHA